MDESDKKPGWLEYAFVVLCLVVIVIADLIVLWPHGVTTFRDTSGNLWLHVVGL
jgi:hypothetical protein